MEDLFGNEVEIHDEIGEYLRQIDDETLKERVRNLSYVMSIAPEAGFMMPHESFLVFTEARDAFVNGLYV